MKFLPNSVNTSCDFKDFGVERCPECNTLWKRDHGHECGHEYLINLIRSTLADTIEMDTVGLQPNKLMTEADIQEHQRKSADLAARLRAGIK